MKGQRENGFTLIELLVVIVITAVLAALLMPAIGSAKLAAWRGVSVHSLKSLISGGQQYLGDHNMTFWHYAETDGAETTWWFGVEGNESRFGNAEGARVLDLSRGPLGPYVSSSGGVQDDPAFTSFAARHKPKYTNLALGYGYNAELGGGAITFVTDRAELYARKGVGQCVNLGTIKRPSEIVVFATCAQVNNFQPPASADKPMIEDFCLLDRNEPSVHFRYGGKALCAFADGSVRELEMAPSTLDSKMPEANIGRFAPKGSVKYLLEE